MNKITIQTLNEAQFRDYKEEWSELLDRSDSDPLFMSWEWQHTWWQVFSEPDLMKLQLFAAFDNSGRLVGIAPLYLSKSKSKKIIITDRLQFIGNCWRGRVTMRTELLDFIVDKSISDIVIKALYSHIYNLSNWNELVLTDLRKDSATYQLLTTNDLLPESYYRHAEEYESFFVNTSGSFDDYIKALGKNSRLRLFNRRKVFDRLGDAIFRNNIIDDIEGHFKLLNDLHAKRWGAHVFLGKRQLFNETVARLMAQKKALSFSTLTVNGKTVSIQYNYTINNHVYNIQAGFEEGLHKKLALGYLHFGYEIEDACCSAINRYDFLAGDGKNTPYKERLTQSTVKIVDLQIIRHPIIKLAYKTHDYLNG